MPYLTLKHQLDYLIGYPYAGTESTLSHIAALLDAQSISQNGQLSGYISGDMVINQYDRPFSLSTALSDARTKIRSYQNADG